MDSNITVRLDDDERGCKFKDKILVPLTPSQVEDIERIYKKLALETDKYTHQGWYRNIKQLMEDALDHWDTLRHQPDSIGDGS